ncbi:MULTISPECIES: HNH endonuclease [Streptomyces]|uniref:HNH endonuclease n=1 Tax=Streptomyces TaxID=1883 RepID=UPI00345C5702
MDHVRPLALGGTDTDGNVQVLCRECHALKTGTDFPRGSLYPSSARVTSAD